MKIQIEINDEIYADLKDAAAFCNESPEVMLHKIVMQGIFSETIKTAILKKQRQNVQSSSSNKSFLNHRRD